MAIYIAKRIVEGAFTYAYAVGRRPDLQAGIDTYLTSINRQDLIEGV